MRGGRSSLFILRYTQREVDTAGRVEESEEVEIVEATDEIRRFASRETSLARVRNEALSSVRADPC